MQKIIVLSKGIAKHNEEMTFHFKGVYAGHKIDKICGKLVHHLERRLVLEEEVLLLGTPSGVRSGCLGLSIEKVIYIRDIQRASGNFSLTRWINS